jgi:predicted N-acetyltransferase YhbS
LICGDKNHAVLILTHLAVLPAYQGFGIGSELISNSFTRAQQLGYHTIFVLGLEDYFNRFGFDRADMYKIVTSLRIEDEELLIIKLAPEGLNYNNGRLVTHPLVRSIFQLIV